MGLEPTRAIAAAAAATAATASVATTSTSAATATGWLRPSFVDGDLTSTDVLVIQALDRLLGFVGIWHLDESKAARAAGFAILHNLYRGYSPVALKGRPQLFFGLAKGQVAHIDIGHQKSPTNKSRPVTMPKNPLL